MDACALRWAVCILLVSSFSFSHEARPLYQPSANLSTLWTINNPSITNNVRFTDGSRVISILLSGRIIGPPFGCGFFCNGSCDSYFFSIFAIQNPEGSVSIPEIEIGIPQVAWSANPNNPVGENATLHLTQEGDLILHNVDGSVAWSTNTAGKSVIRMTILETGNLVLSGKNNSIVWQSFEHPTDTLLPGQKLMAGQRLTARVSASNWSQGLFYLSVSADGLYAFAESNPPQAYRRYGVTSTKNNRELYVIFEGGFLLLMRNNTDSSEFETRILLPQSTQYIRLESDGHLRAYQWGTQWAVADLLTGDLGECNYPTVCGNYGICLNGQCSCPGEKFGNINYFLPVNSRQPNLGCYETTMLSHQFTQSHRLLHLQDISYFSYIDSKSSVLRGTDVETCKQACLKNRPCKAAFFRYGGNISDGDCFLPSELFSLMSNRREITQYNSSAFIKVQIPPSSASPNPATREDRTRPSSKKKTSRTATRVGYVLGALFGAFLIIAVFFVLVKKRKATEDEEDDCFEQVPGIPARFTYEELRAATKNFCTKLGQGGFGSVFMGTLGDDGTQVAVKRLDNIGQVDKRSEDMQLHLDEAVKMIKLGIWCLQSDFTRRPSMSMVIKVLEGIVDMEPILDYSFLTSYPAIPETQADSGISAPPVATILSGPR
ncbi:hypothetical protein MRB53_019969 [Persea americana]|uniref:Uncharacterized protein n=1 Tax=Persea americana TaxID=3435 RepID=A0ACC2KZY2_PERAE|nr:hypothetical protein MRB53_019969 [Persea americana]